MYSDGLLKLPIFTIQKNHKILLTVYSLSPHFIVSESLDSDSLAIFRVDNSGQFARLVAASPRFDVGSVGLTMRSGTCRKADCRYRSNGWPCKTVTRARPRSSKRPRTLPKSRHTARSSASAAPRSAPA